MYQREFGVAKMFFMITYVFLDVRNLCIFLEMRSLSLIQRLDNASL
ncbi:hypothetical protein Pint_07458 [Pistacia integerrima]|uniref:Uncharacterized protein n=1 Tax=Pistacia integerrima TaxID=434235 RepID=A0ACC0XX34_9ROSI|nr:hypothetical protein Pint_07458 [Pistacia integerrima]